MTVSATDLDPAIDTWLRRGAEIASRPPAAGLSGRAIARQASDEVFEEFGLPGAAGAERRAHALETPRGSVRLDEYRPQGTPGDLPAYLILHGGAFRLGELDEKINVAFCSLRSVEAGYAVFCLDYALAPEFPFPAGLNDAVAALRWLRENAESLSIDPSRIVVGGVSAGGALAAAVCAIARDSGMGVRGQLLEVPVTDLRDDGPWAPEYAEVNGFASLRDIRQGYLADDQAIDPRASPLLGDARGLPSTHVMTAELDPLRPSGEAYVDALRAAGVEVSATRHLGSLHASQALLRTYRGARLWHDEVVSVLRDFARS